MAKTTAYNHMKFTHTTIKQYMFSYLLIVRFDHILVSSKTGVKNK